MPLKEGCDWNWVTSVWLKPATGKSPVHPRKWGSSNKDFAWSGSFARFAVVTTTRLVWLCFGLVMLVAGCAHQGARPPVSLVQTTPKLEILDQQIKFNPKDAQAYSNRGYTLALLGRREEARADLQRAVALKDNAPMRNRVGWAYFNMGDYAEAVREFEAAAKLSGFKAHYDYYSLVLGYWGLGDTKRALENYQLAVERDPRLGEYKTLNDRTSEWTPLERRAMHEIYVLWSKTWKP